MENQKGDFSSCNGANKNTTKLVLHVDLRNTILVADSVTSTTVEQGLNSYMTCVAWGKLNENSEWRWINDKLSLESPKPGLISYYSYLESKLVRNARNRAELRQATGDFTLTPLGSQFYDIYEKHRKLLEWKHENVKYLTLDSSYHYALPSFLNCLYKLQEDKRDFSVIIRTYGLDARNMLKALYSTTQGNHPNFKKILNLPVINEPGYIKRDPKEIVIELNDKIMMNSREIYDTWNNFHGICAYVDDFHYWQKSDYHFSSGKPLYLDFDDPTVHHIFFDDNARFGESNSIVDARKLVESDSFSLNRDSLNKLHNSVIVQADLLSAIADQNYFIDKIKLCEENYANLLEEYRKNSNYMQ